MNLSVREPVTPEELAAVIAALGRAHPAPTRPAGYAAWRAGRVAALRVTTATVTAKTPAT